MGKRTSGTAKGLSIIGIILCVVLLPLLVINITLIAKSFLYPDRVPDFMGYKPFIVLSGSMSPTIAEGDLILTRAMQENQTLQEGQIIAYRLDGKAVVTHRITEVLVDEAGTHYQTWGDANNAQDRDLVRPEQVEGLYLARVAGLGRLAMFLQTPLGLLSVVGGPFLLYLLADLALRRKARRADSEKAQALQEEVAQLKQALEQSQASNNKTTE